MAARDVAWAELAGDAAKSQAPLTMVADQWDHRAKQEHLAVGAFSRIAHELAEDGCESVVLSLVTRAANDEVRHAETCARMASCLSGREFRPVRYRGVPKIPMHEGKDESTRVLLHVAEMCCLNETFTGFCFTEMLARTTHPVARTVLASLLEDEIDHGKVGWAYLAERVNERRREGLEAELPELVVRAMSAGMKPFEARPEEDDPALERFAYLGTRSIADLYRQAVREVIAPGFEHLGFDMSATRARLRAVGWD
jgi:hypothetical protein